MAPQRPIVTIFGGTGFLGRYIISALASHGAQIRIATRSPARAFFLKPCGDVGQITAFSCDIHDAHSVTRAVSGSSHVINLVGTLNGGRGKNSFDHLHHLAAQRIAHAAAETGVKNLIHVSALGAGRHAASHYARSKAEGEEAVHRAFPAATILRPGLVFGAEDQFFNRFARIARGSLLMPLPLGGRTRFQPVYVGDIAQAVARVVYAAKTASLAGKTFELGGPDVMTLRDMLDLVMKTTGHRRRFLPLPAPLAKTAAALTAICPNPPLTFDQIRALGADNLCGGQHGGLADLGISPTAMGGILPLYLAQYRRAS